MILVLYVDDMLLNSMHCYELDATQAKSHEAFDMKDLGDVGPTFWVGVLHLTKSKDSYGYLKKSTSTKCLRISIW